MVPDSAAAGHQREKQTIFSPYNRIQIRVLASADVNHLGANRLENTNREVVQTERCDGRIPVLSCSVVPGKDNQQENVFSSLQKQKKPPLES